MIADKLILDIDRVIYEKDQLLLRREKQLIKEAEKREKQLIKDVEKREKQLIKEVEKREEKAKIATAEEMILDNEPLAKIIKYSKLSEKKIRELAKKLSKEIVLQ